MTKFAGKPSGRLDDPALKPAAPGKVLDLEEIPCESLDPAKLAYFERYLDEYFNDAFIPGMGAEEILDNLAHYGRGGRHLDLGSGTSTLFWSIPLDDLIVIECCDIVPEALTILRRFVDGGHTPPCYREVLARHGKSEVELSELRNKISRYLIFDALAPWPDELQKERYDLVTAFGTLGICGNLQSYTACFRELAAHLAPGGRAIGADWIRSPAFIAEDGHDNTYLTPAALRQAAYGSNLRLLDSQEIVISGDPLYAQIVTWVMEQSARTSTLS